MRMPIAAPIRRVVLSAARKFSLSPRAAASCPSATTRFIADSAGRSRRRRSSMRSPNGATLHTGYTSTRSGLGCCQPSSAAGNCSAICSANRLSNSLSASTSASSQPRNCWTSQLSRASSASCRMAWPVSVRSSAVCRADSADGRRRTSFASTARSTRRLAVDGATSAQYATSAITVSRPRATPRAHASSTSRLDSSIGRPSRLTSRWRCALHSRRSRKKVSSSSVRYGRTPVTVRLPHACRASTTYAAPIKHV